MSNTFSITQASNIVAFAGVLVAVLGAFHVNITNEEAQTLIGAVIALVGIGTSWYNRFKKGDVTVGGFRK